MKKYPYQPLELHEPSIRLLQIHRGAFANDIKCTLFEAPLSEATVVPYKALSYAWGGTDHTSGPVLIVGKWEVDIKENLFVALRYIRREDEDVYLWVDALCINQDDEEEKSDQVNQMGRVYETAEEVIVWLGLPTKDVHMLFDLITQVDQSVQRLYVSSGRKTWEDWSREQVTQLRVWPGTTEALEDLLQQSWFERVWILQEIALAGMVIIRCGHSSCKARTFALMPSILPNIKVPAAAKAVLELMPRVRGNTWWTSERNLHTLLQKFRDSQSTHPRDKIYVLLGISDDAQDPKRFFPCYLKMDEEVFRDTASFLVFGEILAPSFGLPLFLLSDLSGSILDLAERIFEWAVVNTSKSAGVITGTAQLLVQRLNSGQLDKVGFMKKLMENPYKIFTVSALFETKLRSTVLRERQIAKRQRKSSSLRPFFIGSHSKKNTTQELQSLSAEPRNTRNKLSKQDEREKTTPGPSRLKPDWLTNSLQWKQNLSSQRSGELRTGLSLRAMIDSGDFKLSLHHDESGKTTLLVSSPEQRTFPVRFQFSGQVPSYIGFLGQVPSYLPEPFEKYEQIDDMDDMDKMLRSVKNSKEKAALLCVEVWDGNEVGAQDLLERGVNVNERTPSGWTALEVAARKKNQKMIRLLLEHGANAYPAPEELILLHMRGARLSRSVMR